MKDTFVTKYSMDKIIVRILGAKDWNTSGTVSLRQGDKVVIMGRSAVVRNLLADPCVDQKRDGYCLA